MRTGKIRKKVTTGWANGCYCAADKVPCLIMDPFCGSGTVGVVSKKLDRDFIGIEINDSYCKLAISRISKVSTIESA